MMAQNDVQYTHYLFNKLAYNPAYAGSAGVPVATAIYRNQWLGLDKSPTTATINYHTPIQCGKGGLGFGFTADKAAIFKSNRLDGAYSYKFNVSEKGILSLGLGAQLEFGSADYRKTNPLDAGDQTIFGANDQYSKTKLNFGAGIYYEHNNNFYIGLSVPQLLNTSYFQDVNISGDIGDFHSYYLMTGFVVGLSENVKLMPGAMISYHRNAPFEFDINANVIFMDKFWLGLNYRNDDSFDALIQYQLSNKLRAGFAYDFTTSELKNHSNGTIEFLLSYSFNNYSNKISNLRYF
jgi:type IX secretion system PorP/SprF family membrane protein